VTSLGVVADPFPYRQRPDESPARSSAAPGFNDEVHARPPETLCAPLRLSYLALFAEGAQRQQAGSVFPRWRRTSASHRRLRMRTNSAPILDRFA
jgi:hypothetical protein